MKITLLVVGKTSSADVKNICADYAKRINRYAKFEDVAVDNSSIKISDKNAMKEKEGAMLLKKISARNFVILLDAQGKEFTSLQLADDMENILNRSLGNICFVIGGAYGFSNEVYTRANAKLSLSKLTFSHQIIRIIFMEQLYRAFTIINNAPYHHE